MKSSSRTTSALISGLRCLKGSAMVLVVLGLYSCIMAAPHLKTEPADPSEVKGTFKLMLYGCRYPDDILNVAILDREEDPYTVEIYAPDFDFKVKEGLSADEALREAERFIRCSFFFERSRISKVLDQAGNRIAYEVRPLYSPIRFGQDDVLDIQYTIGDGKVLVYIKLDPDVEKGLRSEGDGRSDHDGGK